jgi:hypothetical protein
MADWSDNFDSYALGSGLHGQGGWEGWGGDPTFDAYVTDVQSLSSPHSVDVTPTSDIVQPFTETSGQWVMTGYHYFPTGSVGLQHFILLNTYDNGNYSWSLQLEFDSDTGILSTYEGTQTTAIIYDRWVEVRVEIDLDADWQNIYYDGVLLDAFSWAGAGGVTEIAALDLFSYGGSSVYWDDISLIQEEPTTVEYSSWGAIKSLYK